MIRSYTWVSVFFLCIVAFFGIVLRVSSVVELNWPYAHLLHAHSHLAFQGWIYTALMLLIIRYFIPEERLHSSKYHLQFILTVGILIGIMISFALSGYAFFSILFSTLFQFLNYWFIYCVYKDIKYVESTQRRISYSFLRMSLLLGIISTIGPWMVAVLSANQLTHSEWYHAAIYFFMHFQYNGWYFFAILALIFRILEESNVKLNDKFGLILYRLTSVSVFPAFLISLSGMSFDDQIFIPNILTITAQMFIPIIMYKCISLPDFIRLEPTPWIRYLFYFSFGMLSIKVLIQFGAILPSFGIYELFNRSTIMFFLHLQFIGIITTTLLYLLFVSNAIEVKPISQWGTILLVIGFVCTEMILLGNGIFGLKLDLLLLLFSLIMLIGILLILFAALHGIKKKRPPINEGL